jgi:hypothetical protein
MGLFSSLFKPAKKETPAPTVEKHTQAAAPVTPEKTATPPAPTIHLTALEKNFLKYMDMKDAAHPYIADYWTFEYNLKPDALIQVFVQQNLLKISDTSHILQQCSSKELKAVLQKFQLSQTGSKKILIDRILSHLSAEDLALCTSLKPVYYLTDAGKQLADSVAFSATKDPDFEDQCIYHILRQDFDSSYQIICQRELRKNIPGDVAAAWKDALQNGLSEKQQEQISFFFSSPLPLELPEELIKYESEIKACTIFGRLFSLKHTEIAATIARRTGLDSKAFHLATLCQSLLSYLN